MLSTFTADEFQQAGLLPYHFQFAQQFFERNSPKVWLLIAPEGTAKTRMAAHFVSWELSPQKSGRVLILAPAALLDHWQRKITEVDTDVEILIVDRKMFLELESNTAQGKELWPRRSVVVMSIDLAKRQDVRAALVSTVWNLAILDESHLLTGHRLQLFRVLNDTHSMNRGVLLAAIPGTRIDGAAFYEIANDEVTDWNGKPVFSFVERNVYSISYTRSDEEVAFLERLVEVGDALVDAFVSGHFQKEILLRSASSSTYTVETVLRRLLDGWRPVRNKLAHNIPPSAEDLERIQSRVETVVDEVTVELDSPDAPVRSPQTFLGLFSAVDDLMDSIDDIAVDSKLEALVNHLEDDPNLRDKHLCIWTSFRATGDYLNASLGSLQVPVFYINGSVDTFTRSEVLEKFQRSSGIMIVTDVALEGVNLHFVRECINYDLPTRYLQFEQRWGRFLRYGRETPFQMAVFKDRGKSFEWEERLLSNLLNYMKGESNS